jgi:hypothetical protein
MEILAHRGNIAGPDHSTENRLASVRAALCHGWGLEIDVRRARDGRFYVSHDPADQVDDLLAPAICQAIRACFPATLALNVKELGDEAALLELLAEHDLLGQSFLFDMELIEAHPGETAAVFRRLHPGVRLAARVSDRGESVERALAIAEASVIWLDEFDRQWCTAEDVARIKLAGRRVYAVSPDLHGFAPALTERRWHDFASWGVDGICTDYPAALEQRLRANGPGASG